MKLCDKQFKYYYYTIYIFHISYNIDIYHNINLPLMSKEMLSICLLENEHNLLVHN